MLETDIRNFFLKSHKNDHVQYKLKTLTVNLAVAQKEKSEQMKDLYVTDLQGCISLDAHL